MTNMESKTKNIQKIFHETYERLNNNPNMYSTDLRVEEL